MYKEKWNILLCINPTTFLIKKKGGGVIVSVLINGKNDASMSLCDIVKLTNACTIWNTQTIGIKYIKKNTPLNDYV